MVRDETVNPPEGEGAVRIALPDGEALTAPVGDRVSSNGFEVLVEHADAGADVDGGTPDGAGFEDRPPLSGVAWGQGDETAELAPEHWPQIDGYEFIALLGRGGMSAVWRAKQLSTGREVAVKLMGGVLFGSDRSRARFEREIELFGQLNHPNIVRLYDSGLCKGTYYYVMELIEGEHLDRYVRRKGLGDRETVALLAKVADAVGFAHQSGIVHRDVKPSNVMVCPEGEPHLLDFGLARVADGSAAVAPLTQEGAAAGTVGYMSPEQAAGEHGQVRAPSDVFSLGVVMFELLTGRTPHGVVAGEPVGLHQAISGPSVRPRDARPGIDRDLEAIMSKAIAADPGARYATGTALAEDLGALVRGDPVTARRLTLHYLVMNRLRRHRGPVIAGLALMAVFVALAVTSYVQITIQRNRARAHAEATERALYVNRIALVREAIEEGRIADAKATLGRCPERFRGWEWHYFQAAADRSKRTWRLPAGRPTAIAPDAGGGWRVAVAGEGLFHCGPEATRPSKRYSLPPHYAAAAVGEGGLVVLDHTGGLRHVSPANAGSAPSEALAHKPIRSVSPAGMDGVAQVLAADGSLYRWHVASEDVVLLGRLGDRPTKLVAGPDGVFGYWVGGRVVCGRLADLFGGTPQTFSIGRRLRALAFSHDGDRLAALTVDGGIYVIDRDSGQRRRIGGSIKIASAPLCWSGDSNRLAAQDGQGAIHVFDLAGGPSTTLPGHTAPVMQMRFSGDDRLVSASTDGEVKRWDLSRARIARTAAGVYDATRLAGTPGGGTCLVATEAGAVRELGSAEASATTTMPPAPDSAFITALAVTADGRRLASGDTDGGISIWPRSAPDRAVRRQLAGREIVALSFSPDGRRLAVETAGPAAGTLILDSDDLAERARWPRAGPVGWLDSRTVLAAVGGDRPALHRRSLNRPTHREVLVELSTVCTRIAVQGPTVAVAQRDGRVLVFRRTGESLSHVHALQPFPGRRVDGLRLARDGQRLWAFGGAATLWSVPSGAELLRLSGPDGIDGFGGGYFDPRRRQLFALSNTGRIVVWSVGSRK